MTAAVSRAALLVWALASLPAVGAEKRLTLIFTGDNGGEVAPCG